MASVSSCIARIFRARPRCRVFYLEMDPQAFVVQLPNVFFLKFGHEISSRVYFKDSVGNELEMLIDKDTFNGYVLDGYRQLMNFYKLHYGGWLKVFYVGHDVFRISVRDVDLNRIRYPDPPKRVALPINSLDMQVINNGLIGNLLDFPMQNFDFANNLLDSDRLIHPITSGSRRIIDDCSSSTLGPPIMFPDFPVHLTDHVPITQIQDVGNDTPNNTSQVVEPEPIIHNGSYYDDDGQVESKIN